METPTPLESTSTKPTIRFESGMHPLTVEGQAAILQRFKDTGDLDIHIWNLEVARRIRFRDSDMLVLAVDGTTPNPKNRSFAASDDFEKVTADWVKLPARPLELTKSGTLYLVGADFNPPFGDYNQRKEAEVASGYEASMLTENILLAALLLEIMHGKKFNSGQMTRREFLRKSHLPLFLVEGLSLLRSAPLLAAPYSSTSDMQRVMQEVGRITSPKLLKSSVWLDGRTALLSAKIEDVRDSGLVPGSDNQTQYTVVMGSAHQDRYRDFTEKEVRDNALKAFAKEIIEEGRTLYALESKIPKDSVPNEQINNLLDYFALVDITEVRDPREYADKNFYKSGLINACFTEVASFQSPQVESAIGDLRPHAE